MGWPSTRRSLSVVAVTAGLSSTRPSRLTRPSAIQRSASRREQSPARAMSLATRSPFVTAASVMVSAGGLDEGGEQPQIRLADGIFRVPLDADAEPASRVLDAFDDAVGRRCVHDQAGCGRLHRLMMRAVDRRLAASRDLAQPRAVGEAHDMPGLAARVPLLVTECARYLVRDVLDQS